MYSMVFPSLVNKKQFLSGVFSQDLETGWPKIGNCVTSESPIFQQFTQITTIYKYLLIEITHNILTQCHRNCIEVGKFQFYA